MRTEKDFLGKVEIPDDALYGIHAWRAKHNFPDTTAFHIEWYKAIAQVKAACYMVYQNFKNAGNQKYPDILAKINVLKDDHILALQDAAMEMSKGKYFEHFIVPGISGGAGTSINMNINEILANVALQKSGYLKGEYHIIDPVETANVFQSTNDVIPTALKVALMKLLNELENHVNDLRSLTEEIEKSHRNDLRIGFTQMQQAVPSSYGKLFSTYCDALSRDWWRVSKCFERIKVVNMGGGAIGTGLSIPRYFIMEVVPQLQKLTGLPISRGENLQDTTANLDVFVEIHAILKAHAVNLEKIANDLRLLSSDVSGRREIRIPEKQVGSSIMPGKVNPVIPEYIISVAHKVYANDQLITSMCASGCLDLNAYIPIIGHALIESLKLLKGADQSMQQNLLQGLIINKNISYENLLRSPAVTTALSPYIGYHAAGKLVKKMQEEKCTIFEANKDLQVMDDNKLTEILKAENLLKLGYTLKDISD